MNRITGLGLALALWSLPAPAVPSWEMVPVIPRCKADLFCEKDEVLAQVAQAGIVARLKTALRRAHVDGARVSIAFMSFTEESLYTAICDLAKSGLKVDGFFDSKAGPPAGLGHRMETECRQGRRRNVTMHYMGMPKGGKTGWRLHHNKFLLIEHKSGAVDLAFGSANLSYNGLSVNLENWNFVSGRDSDPFIADHLCALAAMKVARKARVDQDDPKVFRAELDRCLSQRSFAPAAVDATLAHEGVLTFFAPDPDDRIFAVLRDQIRRVVDSGRVRAAVYFFMHRPLLEELKAARARGVRVELLIDDDLMNGGGSIPAQRVFWEKDLRPQVSGLTMRYFDTNEKIFQLQHNKFIVLEGVDRPGNTRVFGGAGQFTLSAFRNNYENFYLLADAGLTTPYADLFESLWRRAIELK